MKHRPAFTLLEIILVITIVAIMAMLAVGSYGSARMRAKLDLTADLVVSAIKQRQSQAKSGKALTCYGVIFDTNPVEGEDGAPVQLLEAPYVAVLGNRADFCDFTNPTLVEFTEMENFTISSIEVSKSIDAGTGQNVDSMVLVFKPPMAKLLVGTDVDNVVMPSQSVPVDNPVVTITVTSPNGAESRTLVFDSISGVAKRLDTSAGLQLTTQPTLQLTQVVTP